MDIGTGKDLPVNHKSQITISKLFNFDVGILKRVQRFLRFGRNDAFDVGILKRVQRFLRFGRNDAFDVGYYEIDSMPVWLLDVVEPDKEFSVVDWLGCFEVAVEEIYRKGKLPIVVGGTGFYIDAILNMKKNFLIKPNKLLRLILNKCSTGLIRNVYKVLDKKSFDKLNNSEKNNRHRLIRKIEIRLSKIPTETPPGRGDIDFDCLHVSLTGNRELIKKRIDKRIKKRLKQGLLGEIEGLLKKYKWSDPGMNTLAYKEFEEYFEKVGKIPMGSFDRLRMTACARGDAIERWRMDEHRYAKRQRVWFKKRKEAIIFDIGKKEYKKEIEKMVKKWLGDPSASSG